MNKTDPGKRTSDTRWVTGVRRGRRRRVLSRKWYSSRVVRAWCGACARRAAAAGGAVPSSAATTRSAQIMVYCTYRHTHNIIIKNTLHTLQCNCFIYNRYILYYTLVGPINVLYIILRKLFKSTPVNKHLSGTSHL